MRIGAITSKVRTAKVAGRGTCRCPQGTVLAKTKKGTAVCARPRKDAPVFAKKNAAGTGCVAGAQKRKFKSKSGFYCLTRKPGWLWAGAPVCDVPAKTKSKKKGKKGKKGKWTGGPALTRRYAAAHATARAMRARGY